MNPLVCLLVGRSDGWAVDQFAASCGPSVGRSVIIIFFLLILSEISLLPGQSTTLSVFVLCLPQFPIRTGSSLPLLLSEHLISSLRSSGSSAIIKTGKLRMLIVPSSEGCQCCSAMTFSASYPK